LHVPGESARFFRFRIASVKMNPMKAISCVAVAGILILVGCGQNSSKSASGTNTSTVSANPLDAPGEYVGALVKGQQAAVKTVDIASINKAIQMFNVEEGRNPKDLNELVEKKYLPRIPDVPHGTKLVYDANAGKVSVVNQ
jgi:hypothetical protein